MAETTTTKKINLYQLSVEIGGAPGLRMVGAGDSTDPKTVRSTVAQATLDAKVDAHRADFSIAPPPDPTVANAGTLQENIGAALASLEAADANWALLTPLQKDAAQRLAVRSAAKLARVVLGRFEAT